MARRGSYSKGIAKREEILERALEVVARQGYGGASVRELADAVGLSQAGLLHYFGSKEELFTAILQARDEQDAAKFGKDLGEATTARGFRDAYAAVIRHNAEVPGLVELFARLSVEAKDRDHPAHAFFLARGKALRDGFARTIPELENAAELPGAFDSATLARVLQAVADGLQLQWMLEPDLDMATIVSQLFDALLPPRAAPADHQEDEGANSGQLGRE